jgi:hypothetical protein
MKAPTERNLVSVHEDEIARDDILLGRGGKTNHHPGTVAVVCCLREGAFCS